MGTCSVAIIRKGTTIQQIVEALEKRYTNVEANIKKDFGYIIFNDGGDFNRNLFVSFTDSCLHDYGIDGVYLSLGYFGKSVEILKYLCETFGGYLDENDCDDIDFFPINLEKFQKELTPDEIFQNEIILKFGVDKLNDVLGICEEYLKIKTK
jgi:hypothetical protein